MILFEVEPGTRFSSRLCRSAQHRGPALHSRHLSGVALRYFSQKFIAPVLPALKCDGEEAAPSGRRVPTIVFVETRRVDAAPPVRHPRSSAIGRGASPAFYCRVPFQQIKRYYWRNAVGMTVQLPRRRSNSLCYLPPFPAYAEAGFRPGFHGKTLRIFPLLVSVTGTDTKVLKGGGAVNGVHAE